MSLNVNDRNPELLYVTKPVVFRGLFHRIIKIRATNGFGAPVVQELFVLGASDDDVQKVLTVKEFFSKLDELEEGPTLKAYMEVATRLVALGKQETERKP